MSATAGGVAHLLLMVLTAMIGSLFVCFPAVLLLPIQPSRYRLLTRFVARHWLRFAALLAERCGGVAFSFSGDCEPRGDRRVLVLCNHRTRLDWMLLWSFFARIGFLGSLKIVLKKELKRVPFFGWAMQCFLFIFLERKWEKDEPYLNRILPYIAQQDEFCILMFPEGTDLSESNIKKSNAWSEKHGLPTKAYTLHPRSKGFLHTMDCLGGSVDAIYDVTLAYVDRGERPDGSSILRGKLPEKVYCHTRRYAAAEMPSSARELSRWLADRFDEKEAALAQFYAEQKSANSEKIMPSPTVGFAVSTAVWTVSGGIICCWFILSWATAVLYIVLSSAAFWCATKSGGIDLMDLQAHAPPPAKQRRD